MQKTIIVLMTGAILSNAITACNGGTSTAQEFPYTVVDTILVGEKPNRIALSTAGDMAFVTNIDFTDNRVSAIRIPENLVVSNTPVGENPYDLVTTPDGQILYVTNSADNTVTVLQLPDMIPVDTIPVGNNPYELAITANGEFVYVLNYDTNTIGSADTVSVISTSGNLVTSTFAVGDRPYGIAFSPDATTVYISNGGEARISVVQTTSNTEIASIKLDTTWCGNLAISPDGTHLYVRETGTTVSVINTGNNAILNTITVGDSYNGEGIAVTPNGKYLYSANTKANTVSVIDTDSFEVVYTISGFSDPTDIAVTPDGNRVYVVNYANNSVSVIGK